MARIAAIVNVSTTALNAVAQYAPGLLDAWQDGFLVTGLFTMYAGMLGAIAGLWYLSRLALYLDDRGLKLTFGFLKWLCVVCLALGVAFMLLAWPEFYEQMITRPDPGSGGLGVLLENPPCFLLACFSVSLVVYAWYARLYWLLYRLARGTKPTPDEQVEVESVK
ncbi:MAG: hypothetical protein KAX78_03035 [Phycisphaerae bacterium]|nr:hypothetical protein [Phycisphaerae bacterium]